MTPAGSFGGAARGRPLRLTDLAAHPRLREVLVDHARRALRVQLGLRAVLVVFALGAAVLVSPVQVRGWLLVVVAVYAVTAGVTAVWLYGGRASAVRYGWLVAFGDVAALVGMAVIAGVSADRSWTAEILISGLFVVPLVAAAQLRPGVCLAMVVPTELAYLAVSLATGRGTDEPLVSVLLPVLALLGLSAGCVALSHLERSRLVALGGLVAGREQLLAEVLQIEERERRRLADRLHDGALQYVLAARLDLEDLRDHAEPAAAERIDAALGQTSTVLRSTVGELYPAVLEQVGLLEALRQFASEAAARGGFTVSLQDAGWPAGTAMPADAVLLRTAREMLANVVQHAGARHVVVSVRLTHDQCRLCVRDDGVGIDPAELVRTLAAHTGLAGHRARIQAAGGTLRVEPAPGGGTLATAFLPAVPTPPVP